MEKSKRTRKKKEIKSLMWPSTEQGTILVPPYVDDDDVKVPAHVI